MNTLKTFLLSGLTVLSLGGLKAQEKKETSASDTVTIFEQSQEQKKESPFRLTSAYAGQIVEVGFDAQEVGDVHLWSSTRLGGGAAYDITKTISFNVRSIIDISPQPGETFALGQAFIKSQLGKQFTLTGGLMATPATLLRPFPVSDLGHFETTTDALIPGGAPGVRVDKSGEINLSAGVALRQGDPEYGLQVGHQTDQGKIDAAGWFQDKEHFGAVLSGSYNNVTALGVLNKTEQQSRIGAELLYNIDILGRTGSLVAFGVRNGDLQKEHMTSNALVGVLAVGKVDLGDKSVNIVLGPGYDFVNKRIAVYLQLALQK